MQHLLIFASDLRHTWIWLSLQQDHHFQAHKELNSIPTILWVLVASFTVIFFLYNVRPLCIRSPSIVWSLLTMSLLRIGAWQPIFSAVVLAFSSGRGMIVSSPKPLLGQSSHVWYFSSLVKLTQYHTRLHWSNHLMHTQGPRETRIAIWVCTVYVQNLDHRRSLFPHNLSFAAPTLYQHMNALMIILCQIWLIRTGSCGSCSSQNNLIFHSSCDRLTSCECLICEISAQPLLANSHQQCYTSLSTIQQQQLSHYATTHYFRHRRFWIQQLWREWGTRLNYASWRCNSRRTSWREWSSKLFILEGLLTSLSTGAASISPSRTKALWRKHWAKTED